MLFPHLTPAGAAEPVRGLNGSPLSLYPSVTGTQFRDCFVNQASLAFNSELTAGVSYYSRFGVSELAVKSAFLTLPYGSGSLGLNYNNYGFGEIMYHSFSVSGGMKLTETIAFGVDAGLEATATSTEDAGRLSATCQAGLIFTLSENTRAGLHVVNPVPGRLRHTPLPSALRAGASTYISDNLTLSVLFEKKTGTPLSLSTGMAYNINESFEIKAGYSTENNSLGFTGAFNFASFRAGISFLTHTRLGTSSIFSLSKSFSR
ncbi:MAG: hypothetical protein IH591_17870 [Bacteroidales bacterium]|nr:hypothetical protein [Bacteroidales bacterium]